jgi:hypothetical protein
MGKVNYDKFGKGLSGVGTYIGNNKKPLLYVGGAIAIIVIGFAIVKRIKGSVAGKNIIGGKFISQDIDETKTTISKNTAKNYAENLFDAFNYSFGTDKSIIDGVFSKIKSEDFKLIYNEFGKRSYSGLNGGSPSGQWYAPDTYLGSEELDLIGWLNNELGFGDGALKDKIRKIVEPAGFILEN